MANLTAAVAKHATLTAATVDKVTLSTHLGGVEVVNRDQGTSELYVRVDGTDPTVGGDDCYVVPAASARTIVLPDRGKCEARVICSAAVAYSVAAWDPSS